MIEIEKKWKNVPVSYIPKTSLNVSSEELDIKNGDIIAITTNIKGLDVVHTGFACWVDGKLHLLHASSVMKKVILDSQTLFEYSKNKKAHTGVRVISFSSLNRRRYILLGWKYRDAFHKIKDLLLSFEHVVARSA